MKTRWFQIYKTVNTQKNHKNQKFNRQLLINDKKIQVQYNNKIKDRINKYQDIHWRETKSIMCDKAADVLGYQRKNNKRQMIENNPTIEQLSRIQKEYRIKIENSSYIEEVKKFHNIRNQTMKCIKNEIRKNNETEISVLQKPFKMITNLPPCLKQ